MATVDGEVSSTSSSSSSATLPATTGFQPGRSTTRGPHQDSGPRTVCGGDAAAIGDSRGGEDGHTGKGLALLRLLKEELKERECASLPPMVYDGKSDLCTLGSRPGMECVPLRSPADPYHYHHVTDQTKSLQELQNEVGALLEFRDLVIETFPDLKTKMASASAANSTLTGIPSSSLASSRREWEPGIRTRRKLTQKDHLNHHQQQQQHQQVSSVTTVVASATVVSSTGAPTSTTSTEIHPHHHHHQHQHQNQHPHSLISRSRSNSHSGGSSGGGGHNRKEPKSGDAQSSGSVVIQDSGFSTETSSSKETHSASSSTGQDRTINTGTTSVGGGVGIGGGRLAADIAEDELWNLLDVIHRKSNRLREEVDALQQLEREKCRTNQNGQNVAPNGSSSSSSNSNNNNHHHIHSSSSGSSNLPHHHLATTASSSSVAKTFQNQLNLVDCSPVVNSSKDDVQILRRERDRLFEQLSDYEAEAMAGRIRAAQMQGEVDVLAAAKRDLEGQLQAALSQKLELNTKIHDLHQQFVGKAGSTPSSPDSIKSRHHHVLTPSSGTSHLRKHSSTDSTTTTLHLSSSSPATTSSPSSNSQHHLLKPSATRFSAASSSFAPVVKSVPTKATSAIEDHSAATSPENLGKLDGLLSSPARVNKVRVTDSKKIAAILLETNIVELQRHLLTITVQNQVLQQRLDHATRSRIFMSKKLDKSKEDIDDLKFRLEEKTIELEGTKAQLRVLESKQQQSGKSSVASSGFSPEHHPVTTVTVTTATPTPVKPSVVSTSAGGIVTSHLASPVHQPYHQRGDLTLRLQQSQVSTPSMKAMIPLAMDEILHHSSSTESAQDQQERLQYPETPKRKPSKIPLPGTKGYVAPKPPTGRNFVANVSSQKGSPSPSGSLSNKSLNKSTGSLYMRSTGPSSITSATNRAAVRDSSMNRPESAQSWSRRDTSLEKSRSSSIPVSSKGSPVSAAKPPPSASTLVSSSPQPKAKRDSLTTRVKNLDSLSRLQTAASASTGNLSKSSSKKDLSSTSFSTGQIRPERKQNSGSGIRRVSSASIGRSSSTEHNNNGSSASSAMASPTDATDNGKVRNIRSSFWNWLKI